MLIDTSVWLGLARDPKDVALIGIIERLIEDNLLELVVPATVLKEFLAHRERVAADHGKRLSAHFRIVKEAVEVSALDTVEIGSTLRFLDEVDQKTQVRTKLATRVFNRIEKLLRSGPLIEPSQEVKLAVGQRAIERRAPFHRDENEAADAVIIETYAELVQKDDQGSETRWAFVTRNTDHFSVERGNEKEPHPDFRCFQAGRSEYFVSLPDALRSVEPDRVTKLLQTWELEQPTLEDLIERYVREVPAKKALGVTTVYGLNRLREAKIAKKIASKLQAKDIVEFCRSRRNDDGVEPTTIRQHLIHFRAVLSAAEKEWEILGVSTDAIDDALQDVEALDLVAHSYALRGRRPTTDEIQRLLEFSRKQEQHPNTKIRMADLIEFAVATGRKRSEIHGLRWDDFNEEEKTCVLRRKRFPLSDEAVAIILRQPRSGEFIFPGVPESVSQRFIGVKKKLGIQGIRFLDLRREAVMRMLAAKIPLDRIEAMTGLGPLSLNRYREDFARGDAPRTEASIWKRRRRLRFTPRT